jgi:hypothetical protein
MASEYPGIYTGIVEDNRDPEKMGRLKVRVPIAYGDSSQITTAQIPWALTRGLPAGGSQRSGGLDWLPEVGDQVWVTFLDGEPEKPIWEWSTQSRPQSKKFQLHHYGQDGKPSRAAMTRYGHTIELNESSVIITTAKGNVMLLDDEVDGVLLRVNQDLQISVQDINAIISSLQVSASDQIYFQTEKGFSVKATDMAISLDEDLIQFVGRYSLFVGGALFTIIDGSVALVDGVGSTLAFDGQGNMALTTASGTSIGLTSKRVDITTPDKSSVVIGELGVQISAQNIVINGGNIALGNDATTPVVLTDPLITAFNSHTHSNGNDGSPTGPPVVPLLARTIGSTTTLAK